MQHYLQKSLALLVLASTTLFAVPTDAEVSDIMVNFTVGDTVTSQGCVITINNGNPVTLNLPENAQTMDGQKTEVLIDVSACDALADNDSFTLGLSSAAGGALTSAVYYHDIADTPGSIGVPNEASSNSAEAFQIRAFIAKDTCSGAWSLAQYTKLNGVTQPQGATKYVLCVQSDDSRPPNGIYNFLLNMALTNS